MSVAWDGSYIQLVGVCAVEDAEMLVRLLQDDRAREVDVSNVTHLHAAVVQALLVFRPCTTGVPSDPFTRTWLVPLMDHSRS